MSKRPIYITLIIMIFISTLSPESNLDSYLKQGMKNNLALQQKGFELKKSIEALKEAKAMFLPTVSIEARYSRAGGGRTIDMPIGDLINPVHNTLNQLLLAHSQTPYFPANIENQSIPFLRKTDQETKLRVIQPIFISSLFYNKKIKKKLVDINKVSINLYKEELKLNIKTAYYNHLKTLKVKELLLETKILLNENIEISKSLFRNGKVTEEVLLRSKAELSSLNKELYKAEKNIILSASYFNFLLNLPMDSKIKIDKLISEPVYIDKKIDSLINTASSKRLELENLNNAMAISEQTINLHKSSILPTISAVFDYGIQGENYHLAKDSDYWMGSLVLNWNIFNGGKDKSKKAQAILDKKKLEKQKEEVIKQISLSVKSAYYNLFETKKSLNANKDILKARRKGFDIITKKYKQGMLPQIEFIQSRKNFTEAKIMYAINIYDLYIKKAELEKAVSGGK